MTYLDAFELIHQLADGNQIDANDIAFGDEGLTDQRAWQQEALDTLEDLIVNHGEEFDARFAATDLVDIAVEDVAADRSADPASPQSAIRICLDMARGNVLEDRDMQETIDEQELAIRTVENFVVAHGDALDASMTTLKI
jgi:hypothetical protein